MEIRPGHDIISDIKAEETDNAASEAHSAALQPDPPPKVPTLRCDVCGATVARSEAFADWGFPLGGWCTKACAQQEIRELKGDVKCQQLYDSLPTKERANYWWLAI